MEKPGSGEVIWETLYCSQGNIKMNVKETGYKDVNWIEIAQERIE
jgi:hypothetical protein